MNDPFAPEAPDDEMLERELDLRSLMKTPFGRKVMWWLLDDLCGLFGISFAGEAAHTTSYNEGRRSVGADLLVEIQRLSPADYVHMLSERLSTQRTARTETTDAGRDSTR